MAKYRCKICGYIYDEDKEINKFSEIDNFSCPMCGVPKDLFEEIEEVKEIDNTPTNAVKISSNNVSIERNVEKCINCGICKQTCKIREGLNFGDDVELCLNCGQCIQTCPTSALMPKSDKNKLYEQLNSDKICIAYTSPSVRVSIGEVFQKETGSFEQKKLVGLLKKIGFDYVFDTTTGADLTVMEESSELIDRIKNNKKLPMFTSCCPAWVKYLEDAHPELLENLSTCKSPIGMQGMIVKEYFAKKMNIDKDKLFTVAITPCTAKKFEIKRPEIKGTDLVITVLELSDIVKDKNLKYDDIEEADFDSILGEGTGSGMIFGNTGGVMLAALRTAYYMLTDNNLDESKLQIKELSENLKEITVDINGVQLNTLIIHQLSKVNEILDDIKNGKSKYHFIEVMNCVGGCIGGGGQPKLDMNNELSLKQKRIDSLNNKDKNSSIRYSHDSAIIKNLYNEFLEYPLSNISEELLHTTYIDRKK